ncbi:MAG: autotransporter outer membrane beta-barrel domain-containing protein [Alphaproteobacteria bacterium]|nr:autotransporter outer membrane beta-barrel domain-containing protein [Alphaproteobacteria bacterium]
MTVIIHYTQSRIKNDIRTTDVDTHTLMLYGEYKPSQWFVNGVFSFGWSDYSQKASNGIVSVSSDFDVYATALLLNTGYEAKISKSTTVTPYVGMRYLNVVQDDYIDSDNKQISTDNSDLLTFTAATKVKTDFNIDEDTTITPEVRFGLTYDTLSDSGNSIVSLSNGASYEVKTRRLDRFGVEIGAGVSAFVNDNWEITAGYEGKFKQDYQDHTGTFDIKYNF